MSGDEEEAVHEKPDGYTLEWNEGHEPDESAERKKDE